MARTTCHPEVPPHTPPDGRKKVVYSKVLMMFGREGPSGWDSGFGSCWGPLFMPGWKKDRLIGLSYRQTASDRFLLSAVTRQPNSVP